MDSTSGVLTTPRDEELCQNLMTNLQAFLGERATGETGNCRSDFVENLESLMLQSFLRTCREMAIELAARYTSPVVPHSSEATTSARVPELENLTDQFFVDFAADVYFSLRRRFEDLLPGQVYDPNARKWPGENLTRHITISLDDPVDGGMGRIYSGDCRKPGIGSKVAIKIVYVKDARDPVLAAEALRKEAVIWSTIKHENILPFLGVYRRSGEYGLVAPWIPNGHVKSYIQNNPDAAPLPLAQDLASALEFLHTVPEPRVIHGDLHPRNILISQNGRVLLCDFGLSKLVDNGVPRKTSTAHAGFGVTCYMSPEHIRLDGRTTASDVFAFGRLVLLFYTGHDTCPFAKYTSPEAHYTAHFTEVWLPTPEDVLTMRHAAEFNESELHVLTADCCAKDPNERPNMHKITSRLSVVKSRLATSPPHMRAQARTGRRSIGTI